jgi:hypothetical protein
VRATPAEPVKTRPYFPMELKQTWPTRVSPSYANVGLLMTATITLCTHNGLIGFDKVC